MKPNLREYTVLEAVDLGNKWLELKEQGRYEEAEKYRLEIPLIPGIANNLKERIGIKALIESGLNLSEAVKYYGREWLEEDIEQEDDKPFISEITLEELADLTVKITELQEQARYGEACRLSMKIPLDAELADYIKRKYGIRYLIDKKFNLFFAVKKFGEDWLKE